MKVEIMVDESVRKRVLGAIATLRAAEKFSNPDATTEEVNRAIDAGLVQKLGFIKSIEEATMLRVHVLQTQAAMARKAKAQAQASGQTKQQTKREAALAELETLERRLAELKVALSKPIEPERFTGKDVTVNRDGEQWRIRGTKNGRITLITLDSLDEANKLAKNIQALCDGIWQAVNANV